MKNYLLCLPLLAVCCFATGCSQSELSEPTPEPIPESADQTPAFIDVTLNFASERAMYATIWELMDMTDAERNAWYIQQNVNFISQEDAMWVVVDELKTKRSREEIRTCQDKYSSIFLFNHNEADRDISPYIPNEKPGISLVCNAYGNVTIAGELVNFNDLTSYGQIMPSAWNWRKPAQ